MLVSIANVIARADFIIQLYLKLWLTQTRKRGLSQISMSGVVRRCDGCPEFESDPHFFASGVKISLDPYLRKRGISQNSDI